MAKIADRRYSPPDIPIRPLSQLAAECVVDGIPSAAFGQEHQSDHEDQRSEYSSPPCVQKNPLGGGVDQIALSMKITIAADAKRVQKTDGQHEAANQFGQGDHGDPERWRIPAHFVEESGELLKARLAPEPAKNSFLNNRAASERGSRYQPQERQRNRIKRGVNPAECGERMDAAQSYQPWIISPNAAPLLIGRLRDTSYHEHKPRRST